MATSSRSQFWLFTQFYERTADGSISDDPLHQGALQLLLKSLPGISFYVFQLEKCPETGRLHYQGYMEFDKKYRLSTLRLRWVVVGPPPHFDLRRGTQDQAIEYCSKEETRMSGPWSFGEKSKSVQGQRTDLEGIYDLIKSGHGMVDIIDSAPASFIRYSSGIEKMILYLKRPRPLDSPPIIELYYGSTGTGKSRQAYELYPDLYSKDPETHWWDLYSAQITVLVDDFAGRASKTSLTSLLRLLDRYPITKQVKGAHVRLLFERLIITTNIHPSDWYDFENRVTQKAALFRRITQYWYFSDPEEPAVRVTAQSFQDGHHFEGHVVHSEFEPHVSS